MSGLGSGPSRLSPLTTLKSRLGRGSGSLALVLDHQGEPHAQHGDVDRELVDVHAVQVALDDVELQVVQAAGVDADVEQGRPKIDKLLHHPQQVGAGAARRVDHGHLLQRLGDLGSGR